MFLRPLYRRPVTDTVTDESIIFITWAFYITISTLLSTSLKVPSSMSIRNFFSCVNIALKDLNLRHTNNWVVAGSNLPSTE